MIHLTSSSNHSSRSPSLSRQRRGFTLVELMVSVAIFVGMTALLLAKYGNFNQSVFLTNLAYDVALTIRTAQTYGLSVKPSSNDTLNAFKYGYGVSFDTASHDCGDASPAVDNDRFVLFSDIDDDKLCNTPADTLVSTYTLKRGAVVSGVCVGLGCTTAAGKLDIVFKRPDPKATICLDGSCSGNSYARIEVRATDGNTRAVEIRSNGQISVMK